MRMLHKKILISALILVFLTVVVFSVYLMFRR